MARKLPSLNALRAFEAAARLESLTLAAGELNVAQAAISRHVRDLETWLGAKLFHRTGRGVTLTDDGAALARNLTNAFDQLAAAVDRFDKPGRIKRLVVSSDVAFAALWLIPRLRRFLIAHPDIELVVDPDPRLVDYAKGEADIGIRYGAGEWNGVASEKIFEARVSPVCSAKYWADTGIASASASASAPAPSPAHVIREDHHDYWTKWFAAAGIAVPDDIGGTQVRGEMAIAAAEAGSGFALADEVQAGDALIAGRLTPPFETTINPAGYYLVHAEGARLSRSAQAFAMWLKTERDQFLADLENWKTGQRRPRQPIRRT